MGAGLWLNVHRAENYSGQAQCVHRPRPGNTKYNIGGLLISYSGTSTRYRLYRTGSLLHSYYLHPLLSTPCPLSTNGKEKLSFMGLGGDTFGSVRASVMWRTAGLPAEASSIA